MVAEVDCKWTASNGTPNGETRSVPVAYTRPSDSHQGASAAALSAEDRSLGHGGNMGEHRIDNLARALAATTSRRGALRLLIGGAAVAVAGRFRVAFLDPLLASTAAQEAAPAPPRSCAKQRYDTKDTNFTGDSIDADTEFHD